MNANEYKNKLDNAFRMGDIPEYEALVHDAKIHGYKVMRNDRGNHIVQPATAQSNSHSYSSSTTGNRTTNNRTTSSRPASNKTTGARPANNTPNQNANGKGCGRFLLDLFIVFLMFGLLAWHFEKRAKSKNAEDSVSVESSAQDDSSSVGSQEESEAIYEQLSKYMSHDTRIIYANKLNDEQVLAEFEEALNNMEDTVCVIGEHDSAAEGYSGSVEANGYGNSTFRTMPYSTFWMKSCDGNFGVLSESKEKWRIYNIRYYNNSADEINNMKQQIDQEADDIISCIPQGADSWEKSKIIHDELIKRITYDDSYGDHCHDLYGALVNHLCVCEGYSLAYKYIMNRAGEECTIAVSLLDSSNMNHAWNRLDDGTYVDVTWDDMDRVDEQGEEYIGYDYFCLSTTELSKVDSHISLSTATLVDDSLDICDQNYHKHEGYLFSTYDRAEAVNTFKIQYEKGLNFLTIRYDNAEAYSEAKASLVDSEDIITVIGETGYSGQFWYTYNDELYIISVGLGEYTE